MAPKNAKKEKTGKEKREEKKDVMRSRADEEEEEERLMAKEEREKAKRNQAMARLGRAICAWIALALVFSKQPFSIRPRAPGQNRLRVTPVEIAAAGGYYYAENYELDQYQEAINITSRLLMLPNQYGVAFSDKRASKADKSLSGAWRKTKIKHATLLENQGMMVVARNEYYFGGSVAVILGSLVALLVGGGEYGTVLGCVLIFNASRGGGLEPQPELFVTGGCAVLGLMCWEATRASKKPKRRVRRVMMEDSDDEKED